ncbi:MAG: hypothetical protein ACR2KW_05875, partial [Rubrobacter sp.]
MSVARMSGPQFLDAPLWPVENVFHLEQLSKRLDRETVFAVRIETAGVFRSNSIKSPAGSFQQS